MTVYLISMVKNAVSCPFFPIRFARWLTRLADCGDVEDVKANGGVFGDESECSTPCPGDPLHLCGQGDRLNTYFWNGTVNNWHKPANIGRYEVCRSLKNCVTVLMRALVLWYVFHA